jgi:hypothetical protein
MAADKKGEKDDKDVLADLDREASEYAKDAEISRNYLPLSFFYLPLFQKTKTHIKKRNC